MSPDPVSPHRTLRGLQGQKVRYVNTTPRDIGRLEVFIPINDVRRIKHFTTREERARDIWHPIEYCPASRAQPATSGGQVALYLPRSCSMMFVLSCAFHCRYITQGTNATFAENLPLEGMMNTTSRPSFYTRHHRHI